MYALNLAQESQQPQLSVVANNIKPPLRAKWIRNEEGQLICKWS